MSVPLRPLPTLLTLALTGCQLVDRTVVDRDKRHASPTDGASAETDDRPWDAADPSTEPDSGAAEDTGEAAPAPEDTGSTPGATDYAGLVSVEEYAAACVDCFTDGSQYRVTAHARFHAPEVAPPVSVDRVGDTCVDLGASAWASRVASGGGLDAGSAVVLDAGSGDRLSLGRYATQDGGHVYLAPAVSEPELGPGRSLDATLTGGGDIPPHTLTGAMSTQGALSELFPSVLLESAHTRAFGSMNPGSTLTWAPSGEVDLIEVALFIYEPSGGYPLDHVVICTGPDDGSLSLPASTLAPFDQHLAAVQVARISISEHVAPWDDALVQGVAVATTVGTATLDSGCEVGTPCPPPVRSASAARVRLPTGSHPAHRLDW